MMHMNKLIGYFGFSASFHTTSLYNPFFSSTIFTSKLYNFFFVAVGFEFSLVLLFSFLPVDFDFTISYLFSFFGSWDLIQILFLYRLGHHLLLNLSNIALTWYSNTSYLFFLPLLIVCFRVTKLSRSIIIPVSPSSWNAYLDSCFGTNHIS